MILKLKINSNNKYALTKANIFLYIKMFHPLFPLDSLEIN